MNLGRNDLSRFSLEIWVPSFVFDLRHPQPFMAVRLLALGGLLVSLRVFGHTSGCKSMRPFCGSLARRFAVGDRFCQAPSPYMRWNERSHALSPLRSLATYTYLHQQPRPRTGAHSNGMANGMHNKMRTEVRNGIRTALGLSGGVSPGYTGSKGFGYGGPSGSSGSRVAMMSSGTAQPAGAEAEVKVSNNSVSIGLDLVRSKMEAARGLSAGQAVELIAVSKTKPIQMLQEAYDAGQRAFGENYAQELLEKAPLLPGDIEWHFIGMLQSNKVNPLVKNIPNLKAVHTLHTQKVARRLARACESIGRESLDVYIQVDTSGETSKSGVKTEQDMIHLAKLVSGQEEAMGRLRLKGVMTIGAIGDLSSFEKLKQARDKIASAIGVSSSSLSLSMGMSGDFEEAIKHGSNVIRVGSSIFGARDYSKAD